MLRHMAADKVRVHLSGTTRRDGWDPALLDESFPDSRIGSYVSRHLKRRLVATTVIGGRSVKIEVGLFSEPGPHALNRACGKCMKALAWLHACTARAPEACARMLRVVILPTPFPKRLPGSRAVVLGPPHANSGYTYGCSPDALIVVYREEEWFKVFVHETFHCFDFDAAARSGKVREAGEDLIRLEGAGSVNEAYAETWARIINVVYSALPANNAVSSRPSASLVVRDRILPGLALERSFSALQLAKVLNHAGMDYRSITRGGDSGAGRLYRENTPVLAYYVITGILMNDFGGFLGWCDAHNRNLYALRPGQAEAFAAFLRVAGGNDELGACTPQLSAVVDGARAGLGRKLRRTLRMSIVDGNDWEIDST